MGFRLVGNPVAENWLNNAYNHFEWEGPGGPWGWEDWPERGYARSAPGELPYIDLDPALGRWRQGPKILSRNFKPKKYWARPCDGKRRGAWGRLKDGLTGEGPDVFAVLNGDPRTLSRDLPHRAQWSGWDGPDWDRNWWVKHREEDKDMTWSEDWHENMPWADRMKKYNFKTRKYEGPSRLNRNARRGSLWTDAHWPEGARRRDRIPLSYRTMLGVWDTRVPWYAAQFAGGRVGR